MGRYSSTELIVQKAMAQLQNRSLSRRDLASSPCDPSWRMTPKAFILSPIKQDEGHPQRDGPGPGADAGGGWPPPAGRPPRSRARRWPRWCRTATASHSERSSSAVTSGVELPAARSARCWPMPLSCPASPCSQTLPARLYSTHRQRINRIKDQHMGPSPKAEPAASTDQDGSPGSVAAGSAAALVGCPICGSDRHVACTGPTSRISSTSSSLPALSVVQKCGGCASEFLDPAATESELPLLPERLPRLQREPRWCGPAAGRGPGPVPGTALRSTHPGAAGSDLRRGHRRLPSLRRAPSVPRPRVRRRRDPARSRGQGSGPRATTCSKARWRPPT